MGSSRHEKSIGVFVSSHVGSLGPVMLDLAGRSITAEDRERLKHPQCGGVILFARNVADVDQVRELAAEIRALRSPQLLIAVDQEGGQVQRLKEGFLSLPPPRQLGVAYDCDPAAGLALARDCGWAMASECLAAGIDFSFAPVLDIDYGTSTVIGDRAFHSDPQVIIRLASAYISGMHKAGMAAVVKHFPGHGHVIADSHLDIAVDARPYAVLAAADIEPFRALIAEGIDGVMPAHVIYSDCDPNPAGFSAFWLKDRLRQHLGFEGAIFSDDLSMQAAVAAGTPAARAETALSAGCDMLLVCNDPAAASEVLNAVDLFPQAPQRGRRLERMRRKLSYNWEDLHASTEWLARAAPWT